MFIKTITLVSAIGLISSCSISSNKEAHSRLSAKKSGQQNLDNVFLAGAVGKVRLHMTEAGVEASEIDQIVSAVEHQFKQSNLGFNLSKNEKMQAQFQAILGAVIASKANSLSAFDKALNGAAKALIAITGQGKEAEKFETSVLDTLHTFYPSVSTTLKTFVDVKSNAVNIKALIASKPAPTPGQVDAAVAEILGAIVDTDS